MSTADDSPRAAGVAAEAQKTATESSRDDTCGMPKDGDVFREFVQAIFVRHDEHGDQDARYKATGVDACSHVNEEAGIVKIMASWAAVGGVHPKTGIDLAHVSGNDSFSIQVSKDSRTWENRPERDVTVWLVTQRLALEPLVALATRNRLLYSGGGTRCVYSTPAAFFLRAAPGAVPFDCDLGITRVTAEGTGFKFPSTAKVTDFEIRIPIDAWREQDSMCKVHAAVSLVASTTCRRAGARRRRCGRRNAICGAVYRRVTRPGTPDDPPRVANVKFAARPRDFSVSACNERSH